MKKIILFFSLALLLGLDVGCYSQVHSERGGRDSEKRHDLDMELKISPLINSPSTHEKDLSDKYKSVSFSALSIGSRAEVSRSIWRITLKGKTIGTAFLYKPFSQDKQEAVLLTAAHVLDGFESTPSDILLEHVSTNLKIKMRGFIRLHPDFDAMIVIPEKNKMAADMPALLSNNDFHDTDFDFDDLYVFSMSNFEPAIANSSLLFSKAYLKVNPSGKDFFVIHVDDINKGGSGSPVVIDKFHTVIGMVTTVVTHNKANEEMSNVLSIWKIDNLIRDYRIRVGID